MGGGRPGLAPQMLRQEQALDGYPSLDRIDLEAARLDHLIGQMLALSRLEAATEKAT